jgi:hypothetical protein
MSTVNLLPTPLSDRWFSFHQITKRTLPHSTDNINQNIICNSREWINVVQTTESMKVADRRTVDWQLSVLEHADDDDIVCVLYQMAGRFEDCILLTPYCNHSSLFYVGSYFIRLQWCHRFPRVIHSMTYHGYMKPRIIPNAIYNVIFV